MSQDAEPAEVVARIRARIAEQRAVIVREQAYLKGLEEALAIALSYAPELARAARDECGDYVCEHGTALDVHCCNCHSGFIFEANHECPDPDDHDCLDWNSGGSCFMCHRPLSIEEQHR